ncbi:MAG: 2,5-dichloro-2,5-cyclohexadiene-1,4-diol dehydrogenase [Candidatus Rokubacteria bacterium GWC2_70_24]|nr:MAG: 2,5-dichloro-2,5-cyclohexadiene-1,4-diol dehydrogenase [Candidatus Rokubacteria bacterium GWC2_70_24]
MGKLDGKVAIVTGGTSGIGRRTAEVFVEEGASVVIAARRLELGQEIAAALGSRAVFLRTDITQEADVQAMVAHAVARFGRLDCLFNNAGGPAPAGGIETIPLDRFDAAIAVLLRSVMLGMKHAAPIMKTQGSGSIINNGSVAGLRAGFSSSMIYGAAKAAVIQLTRCVAMELGERGVRVNSISPGAIATGIFGKVAGLPDDAAEKTAEVMKQIFTGMQPLPGPGLPEDIARAAVFLASDDSRFINGHDLVVDGGIIGGRLWTPQQEALGQMRAALRQAAGEP